MYKNSVHECPLTGESRPRGVHSCGQCVIVDILLVGGGRVHARIFLKRRPLVFKRRPFLWFIRVGTAVAHWSCRLAASLWAVDASRLIWSVDVDASFSFDSSTSTPVDAVACTLHARYNRGFASYNRKHSQQRLVALNCKLPKMLANLRSTSKF